MKRLIIALLLGGAIFGTVWGLASTLSVDFGTAASGSGDVGSCGDVTGSTYVLDGQTVSTSGNDTVTGDPSDITVVTDVNIEVDDCDEQNAFIALYDGEGGGGTLLATGSCVIQNDGEKDGLGWDEAAGGDNVGGCTADLSADVDIEGIESLVVTIT